MSKDKIPVYATYDTVFKTWNVVDLDRNCLFYGTAWGLDKWIINNKDKYIELDNNHKVLTGETRFVERR